LIVLDPFTLKHFLPSSQPNSVNFLPTRRTIATQALAAADGIPPQPGSLSLRLSLDPTAALGLSGMKAKTSKTSTETE
jgi:hypothetical protein